jgi:uncharacterized DUF497 family protein
MDFEWDEAKNQQNIAKHGIDFENAKHIFDKPVLLRLDDRKNYGESRLIAIGAMNETVVVMTFTLRQQHTRIISARKGNKNERKIYQDQISSRQN